VASGCELAIYGGIQLVYAKDSWRNSLGLVAAAFTGGGLVVFLLAYSQGNLFLKDKHGFRALATLGSLLYTLKMIIYPLSITVSQNFYGQLIPPLIVDCVLLVICLLEHDKFIFWWWLRILVDSISYIFFEVYLIVDHVRQTNNATLAYLILAVIVVPILMTLLATLWDIIKILIRIYRKIRKLIRNKSKRARVKNSRVAKSFNIKSYSKSKLLMSQH
jgi:hypothetical protein